MESMVSPQFSAVERKLIRAVMEENVEELEQICVSLPTDFNINDVFEKSYTLYGSLEETPLLYLACCAKNSDILKILVKYGGDLYINKLDGTNIFHYACGNKNLDVMKFILEECSDVDFLHTFSNNGNDMLSFVADSFEENQKEAQVLIECLASKGKFNINRIQGDGFTVLLKAVSLNRCELADILCQLGGDVNFGYLNSLKAIQWVSMQCGYHNMIQILINHGANKNEIWRGQRPIHLALSRGLTENATVLMRAGVDISGSIKLHYPKKMWISTFCLAAWRCPTLIPEFLALGASPNEMDRSTGYSVIEFALEGNASRDVIKSLLQAGADINRGCPGKTAIEFCKSIDQLLAFIDWGVSVKTIESQIGTSLLSMAISNSSEDTAEEHVKYLLSKGANLKDPANGKDSILISSLKRRFYRIADFLIGQGVNLNHRDGEWSTALHVICKQVDGCSPRRITFGKTALFFCQNFECRRTMPAAQFHSTQSSSSAPCNGSESFQHEKIVKLVSKLLATGSSVNAKNVAEITPLLAALNVMPCKSYPHIKDEVIKILLDNGADINVWFKKENKSALCHSIESEEVETTKLLVEAGYDVNTKEADGELPIFCCLPLDTTARRELFCFLLESGTNPNAEDNKGICLLDHVFSLLFSMSSYYIQFNDLMQDPRAVELKEMFCSLLNKNANPNTAREGEDSLLIRAIRCGSTDIVLLLVQAGANIAHRGENKITAVDWCCHLSEYTRWYPYTGVIMTESGLKIMDILIENDMPLDIPNFDGKYPLDLVMSFNNTDVQIEEMLLRGADPNKFDEREESLLIRSVYRSPSVTLALLKAGAETKMKAMDGRSVYDLFIDKECAVEIQMRTQTIQEEVFIEIIDWRLMQVQSILDQLQSEPITTETERSLILRFEDSYSCWRVVRRIENSLIISEKGRLQINGNHSQNVWFTIQKKLDSRRADSEEKGISMIQLTLDACEVIKALIDADAIDVNSQTSCGLFPLCVAVKLGSLSLLKFLLEKNANPNIMECMDETPLFLALIHGDVNMVRALLEADANVNHVGALPGNRKKHKESILSRLLDEKGSLAPCDKRFLLLRVLIEHGANVNIDKNGVDSLLIKGVKMSSLKLVAELLKVTSQINHQGEDLSTALHVCCEQGIDQDELNNINVDDSKSSIFNLLLISGASVNIQAINGETPVHVAVRQRCGHYVTEMLKRDFEINTKDTEGLTCLMVCMKWAEDTVVKELLKFGADVALEDKNGNTALHYLCSEGPNLNLLNILIECGANVNACNKEGYSPLNALIKKRDIFHPEDVSILISKGADPSCCSEGCESPSTNALTRLKFDTAKLLVKNGADVNYVSKSGKTALYAVLATYGDEECISGRGEIVECLLEAGCDANILLEGISPLSFLLSLPVEEDTLTILSNLLQYQADPNIGLKNPISLAAKHSVDAVKLLLKARGDVNKKDTDEETPLVNCLLSSVCDKIEILRVLIEAGADTNVASNSGKYPIEIALESAILHKDTSSVVFINSVDSNNECEEIVTLLLENEARCNVSEAGKESPLHLAVSANITKVIKLLLANGADVNHKGKCQQTPIHRYFTSGNSTKMHFTYRNYSYAIVKEPTLDLLLSSDATVNIEDENGLTPLHYALEQNAEEFRKLLEVGADPFFDRANVFEKCFALDDLSFLHTILEYKGSSRVSDSLFFTFWSRQNDEIGHGNRQWIAKVTMQILASPHKINVNIKNRYGNTPLSFFCEQTEPVIVEKLLERGADVNMICRRGWTALHAFYNSSDSDISRKKRILSSLMKMNPDVDIKDDSCMTVIEKAQVEYIQQIYSDSRKSFLSVLIKEILLAGGKYEKRGLPLLLQVASKRQHFSLMTTLIQSGVDLRIEKNVLHSCFQRDNCFFRESEKGSQRECLDFLLAYIKHGGQLNEVDAQENTPLMLYLMFEVYDKLNQEELTDLTDEIVSVLAKDKSIVTRRNKSGSLPIHLASQKGRLSTMKLLECKGANLCDKDEKGNTCLHLLLSKGKTAESFQYFVSSTFFQYQGFTENLKEMIEYLVVKGVSVNEINKIGETPLFLLIRNAYTFDEFDTTVRFLLESGADPNIQLKHNNPLVAALQINSVNVAALLLEYGAEVNDIEDGPTALHVLLKNYHEGIIRIKGYLKNILHFSTETGNVNTQDSDGETALAPVPVGPHSVNQSIKMEDIIQKILDCGADVNALDDFGHSPLSIVCEGKSGDSAERARIGIYLMSKGADPDKGCALHQAIVNMNYYDNNKKAEWSKFILEMMDLGANPITYKDEKPILLSAIESGCTEVVKGLLGKGVDIHATDSNNNTCLHLACGLKKHTERNMIATLLLKHGCSINKSNAYGTFPLSNLIKRMTKDKNSKTIVEMETRAYAEVDLSLFNLLICGGSYLDTKMKMPFCNKEESILSYLTKHGYLKAAGALIKCGYDFQNDEDFKKCNLEQPANSFLLIKKRWHKRVCCENEKKEFLKLLEIFQEVDFSLSSLCKDVIRNHLINVGQGAEIESKIMRLPLPNRIKTFLSLREHMEEVEKIQIEKEESMSAYLSTSEDSEDDDDYDEYYNSDYPPMYDDDSYSYGDDYGYDHYPGYIYDSDDDLYSF